MTSRNEVGGSAGATRPLPPGGAWRSLSARSGILALTGLVALASSEGCVAPQDDTAKPLGADSGADSACVEYPPDPARLDLEEPSAVAFVTVTWCDGSSASGPTWLTLAAAPDGLQVSVVPGESGPREGELQAGPYLVPISLGVR